MVLPSLAVWQLYGASFFVARKLSWQNDNRSSIFAERDTGISLLSLQQAFDTARRHAIEQGIPEDSFQRIKSRYSAGVDEISDPRTYAREKSTQASIERQTYIPIEIERLIASKTTLEDINSLLKHFDQPGRQIILRATPSKE